ncbi:MAG TPA: PKD domain-containing protein [Chitinophagaceae bacterium]|nr:PKD domain-containing protein [Chitinophagaceae bacterium]
MSQAVKFFACIFLLGYFFLSSCQQEVSCDGCFGNNRPPIANAGKDQFIVLPVDSVLLDGSASKDPDGSIVSYNWKYISGPSSYTINSPAATKTIVKGLINGTYGFVLTVTDNGGLSAKDTVNITVDKAAVNHPPVAVAGADTTLVLPADSILLDGSNSWDPDNNITSYAWHKLSGLSSATISDPTLVKLQVDNMAQGVYSFELTVTDAGGLSDKDTIRITVSASPNKPPVAKAGPDQAVAYDLQTCSMEPSSITLNGTSSYDPDGSIVSYQWSIILADDHSILITNPNNAITTVTNLTPGTYQFKLLVTDNQGATAQDTLLVTAGNTNRPTVFAQLIPVGNLSIKRMLGAVATNGNKIFFAGGTTPPTAPGLHPSSRVDIYDVSTNTWSTAELSEPRWGLTAVASGNKVYFAGGTGLSGSRAAQSSRIDVYDLAADTWSTLELPRPGWYSSVAGAGGIYFAGGTAIDIYDPTSDRWSSKNLSQPRYQITTTNSQGKLFFAGGSSSIDGGTPYSTIDVYDATYNTWSQEVLSKPKYGMAGIGMRGQNVWAGGNVNNGMTNEVEIYNYVNEVTRFGCLFQSNSFSQYSVARSGNEYVFFVWGGAVKNQFDIYDALNDTWTIGQLDQIVSPSFVITVNNAIYVVGTSGSNNDGYYDQVWKLQF